MYLRDNKFIISCPARSGSTMLLHLLRSHPEIMCHGEVFGGDQIGHLAGTYARKRREEPDLTGSLLLEYRMNHPDAFLYDVVFDAQGRAVSGFKFKSDEAFDERYADIQSIVVRDKSIKVIQLRRRNILDQYISHQVVLHQTGVTMIRDGEERPSVEPFSLDVRAMIEYVLDVLSREQKVQQAYAEHRRLVVDYEDLVHPDHPSRDEMLRFLGVSHNPLTTPTRKILASNESLVLNIDEAREAFRLLGLGERAGLQLES